MLEIRSGFESNCFDLCVAVSMTQRQMATIKILKSQVLTCSLWQSKNVQTHSAHGICLWEDGTIYFWSIDCYKLQLMPLVVWLLSLFHAALFGCKQNYCIVVAVAVAVVTVALNNTTTTQAHRRARYQRMPSQYNFSCCILNAERNEHTTTTISPGNVFCFLPFFPIFLFIFFFFSILDAWIFARFQTKWHTLVSCCLSTPISFMSMALSVIRSPFSTLFIYLCEFYMRYTCCTNDPLSRCRIKCVVFWWHKCQTTKHTKH